MSELKKLPKSEVSLTIEVPAQKLEVYETEAAEKISANVEISGFRKGQAPRYLVIARIGPEAFFEEVLNVALPRSYFEAVKEQKLEVISGPEVKILSKSPLKYEARVAIMPEVKLKNTAEIKIPEEAISVTDEELDRIVDELRRYHATYEAIERPVEKGDRIEIDFSGTDESGVALENVASKNHPLFVGEESLIPGFEEQLIGMKTGETKKFPLTFPKDYQHKPFQNKKVHFSVTVRLGEKPILPELNEAFVKRILGEAQPVSRFRSVLKEDQMKRKQLDARQKREAKLLQKLVEEGTLDVPPLLIAEEVQNMIEDFKRDVTERGGDGEKILAELKKSKKDPAKEFEPEAIKRVKIRLILQYLFKELNIEVSDKEFDAARQRLLARSAQNDHAFVEKQLKDPASQLVSKLINNIKLEKLLDHFLGK